MGNTTSDAAPNQPTPLLKKGGQERKNRVVSWTYFFVGISSRVLSAQLRDFVFRIYVSNMMLMPCRFGGCGMEIHAVRPCLSDGVSSMLLGSSWQQDMMKNHLGELMGTQVCTYIYICCEHYALHTAI